MIYVTTLYVASKTRGRGLYLELAILGFLKTYSLGLCSAVARRAVLLPSFAAAQADLRLLGVAMDIKSIHGITLHMGKQLLAVRLEQLNLWRNGNLAPLDLLHGKRVGVATDGGRVRLRERCIRQKGRGKNKSRKRYYTPAWREPKAFVIFELDEEGRQRRGGQVWVQSTMQGPDHLMELLAMSLHHLGAAKAESVTFLADGAPWIWQRYRRVAMAADLDLQRCRFVLDWCHAVAHLSTAIHALHLPKDKHQRLYERMRKMVRDGRVLEVVERIEALAGECKRYPAIANPLDYLRRHHEHMAYAALRKAGRPMGSGAIESTIRRLLNLRMKGNGSMWKKENCEAVMALRAAAMCGHWDQAVSQVHARLQQTREDPQWRWKARSMVIDAAPEPSVEGHATRSADTVKTKAKPAAA